MRMTSVNESPGATGRIAAVAIATLLGTTAALSTLAGFLGALWWGFDLLAHFRVQYLGALLLVVPLLAWSGAWRWVPLFGLCAAMNLWTLAPFLSPASTAEAGRVTYRALLMNVQVTNREHGRVLEAIERLDPDLLVLLETDRTWLQALSGLSREYPHQVLRPRDGHFGIALFSRVPLDATRVVTLDRPDNPTIKARLTLGGRALTVIATHPLPPIGRTQSSLRNRHLALLPDLARNEPGAVLLLGDLNVTPWSPHFRSLLEESGWRDASVGRGWQPTWPVHLPLALIPIDHCLHSPDLLIVDKRRGPGVGSDHYPVLVDFTFPTAS